MFSVCILEEKTVCYIFFQNDKDKNKVTQLGDVFFNQEGKFLGDRLF